MSLYVITTGGELTTFEGGLVLVREYQVSGLKFFLFDNSVRRLFHGF